MRSFGPGMSSGGGGGGGGIIRTVHRAIRAGIGGGASQEPYSQSTTATTRTTSSNRNQPINTTLSLSSNTNPSPSSYINHPVPAATPPNWPLSSPTTSEEFDWECVDGGSDGESVNGIYDDFVFGSVPSKDEVHHAFSSLQGVLDPVSFSQLINRRTYNPYDDQTETNFQKSGSELDWIEPSMELCNSTSTIRDSSSSRVYDAFHLLQTEPSVQRMVISLSSDKAVWDAVMNNEVVRELRESINEDKSVSEDDVDGSHHPVKQVIRWIFVNTKEKVVEIVEKITKIVNGLVRPMNKEEKWKREGGANPDSFEEKLRSSFLLSVMVLLIVVVSRTRKSC